MEARFSRLEGFQAGDLTAVVAFELGRWNVCPVAVQPAVVEPVDPFQGPDLDVVQAPPGTVSSDEFGLVEPEDGLRGGVVVGVPALPDRGQRPDVGEALGVGDREVPTPRSE